MKRCLTLLIPIGLALSAALPAQDPAAERLVLEAERLERGGDAAGAASQLSLLVSRFPRDRVTPGALLKWAKLERARGDVPAARRALETLLGDHARAPEAAEALLLQAGLVLDAAAASEDLTEAQNLYRRVVLLFGRSAYPTLPARQTARIESGLLSLALGDPAGAAGELVGAIEDEPPGPETDRARLALARAHLASGPWTAAAALLETVAGGSRDSRSSAEARRLLSLIHRRILRPLAGQPPWEQAGRFPLSGAEVRELSGVAVSPDGRLLLSDRRLPLVVYVDAEGREIARQPLADVDRPGFLEGGRGGSGESARPFVVGEGGVVLPFEATSYAFTDPKRAAAVKNVLAAVPGSFGDWFVAAKGTRGLIHQPAGRPSRELLSSSRPEVVDLARDFLGRIYALDARSGTVIRLTRDAVSEGGAASGDWKRAAALDVDELGTLYVLDRGERRVELYSPDGRPAATVGPDLGGGIELRNPVDLAVDGAGRLFIADSKLPFLVVLE